MALDPTTRATDPARYGTRHKQTKAAWQTRINLGPIDCAETICLEERDGRPRAIPAGTPGHLWHLAHTPDGTAYRGPAHPRCNSSEAGTRNTGGPLTTHRWKL